MSASGMGMVDGAEVVEVEDMEAAGRGLVSDAKRAAWRALSSWRCTWLRSLRLWDWGRAGASDPEGRRLVRFLHRVSGSVGKVFREPRGYPLGDFGERNWRKP